MIDLHTHLLPDWDDGARNPEAASRMVEIAAGDGIEKIALTPHIFRFAKDGSDLPALEEKMTNFIDSMASCPVALFRGAEIFVHPELPETLKGKRFAINGSNYFFIEFPSDYVPAGVKELLYQTMLGGFVPIISHPERNRVFGEHPDLLYEMVRMGAWAQVTAMSLTGGYGQAPRKAAHLFLKHNLVHFIASDAHNAAGRPPVLGAGMKEAEKIVGREKAEAMVTSIPQAILDNRPIADWGEPENPERRKKWAIKISGRKI